ncbi:MAG: response regulator transcription factor [Chitinophagaceae bacterium]|nr:response regulator transcription factor [Chitinophagaceae bacterium]
MKAKIALVDDHVLLRNGLANLLRDLDYEVLFEANTGEDFLDKLKISPLPDLVLMDINMPQMDGYETTLWLKTNYPEVKVLALSMYDDENAIIRMIKSGARGYILKDSEPSELKTAIHALLTKGFYHSELVTGKLIHAINHLDEPEHSSIKNLLGLNEKEIEFIKLAATEMTYKEIAERMFLSPRTIEGYRDALFEKLNVKNRVGLVLFAIKNGIVNV